MLKIGKGVTIGPNVETPRAGKIGFTCGAFDLLHAGHALMLKEAAQQCDYLIVGVQGDPSIDRPAKNKPVQCYEERIIMASAIKWVDEIALYNTEEELYKLLKELKPDIRIVGADWRGKEFTGHDLPIEVYYNTRDHNWSTSFLRDRVYEAEKSKRPNLPDDLLYCSEYSDPEE